MSSYITEAAARVYAEDALRGLGLLTVETHLDVLNNAQDYHHVSLLQQIFIHGKPEWIPGYSGVEAIYGMIVSFNAAHPIDGRSTVTYKVRPLHAPRNAHRQFSIETTKRQLHIINPCDVRRISECPSLSRTPRLKPMRFGDNFESYELGKLEVHGLLVLEVARNAGVPNAAGALIEVCCPLGGRNGDTATWTWRGTLLAWCFKTDYNSGERLTEITIRPIGGPILSSNKPNTEDTNMKVYDAVILKLDDKGEVESIAKTVPAFLAKDSKQAREAVMVDYAIEAKLTGKDLAGYSVRVRCFQEPAL